MAAASQMAPATRQNPLRPAGERPAGGPTLTALRAALRTAFAAPFIRRSWTQALYCLLAPLLALLTLGVVYAFVALGGLVGLRGAENAAPVVFFIAILALAMLATRMARAAGALHRGLAALLGERVPPPPRVRSGRGVGRWLAAGFADGYGWRCSGYLLLRIPLAAAEWYAAAYWVTGLVNLGMPIWFALFGNHPGDPLAAVPVLTPYSARPLLHVTDLAGALLAGAVGAATLFAAPWVTRAVVSADRSLIRSLLGPGKLAQRVRDLEATRALAVEDSAVLLRRVERDLHDGAQIHLATLAMDLGMAKEKLSADNVDVATVRDLVEAAHRRAKDALGELRDLVRGIHPPVLDNGLDDALASLAATSPIPVTVTTDIQVRPTPAIETIAYFCVAELLANAAKHSRANTIDIVAADREGTLVVSVADDGVGRADPARGTGLAGLAQRVRTVDGWIDVDSPPGGPTRITAVLPLRA
jgi:signal transduction histidine kinase